MVFGESRSAEARDLMAHAALGAPSLLKYELANIAWKKAQRHQANPDRLAAALNVALALEIEWIEVSHEAAFRLGIELGITAYDASYLYCARELGVPLLTFDSRLAAAADA